MSALRAYLRVAACVGAQAAQVLGIVCGAAVLYAAQASAQTGGDYFAESVAVHVESCMACHQTDGVADASGARLILQGDGQNIDDENYAAFESYLAYSDVDAALLLAKVSGGAGHGGGNVHARGSKGYIAIADLAAFIEDGVASGGGDPEADFWRGLVLEPRERTLRRAGIIMGGKLPWPAQIAAAKKSDANLRAMVMRMMNGQEFHKFLIAGADDRLHTLGFWQGLLFAFEITPGYPAADIQQEIPDCDFGTSEEKDFTVLNRCTFWDHLVTYGMIREPLELIAFIIEKNFSYKQILTANYTVANQVMNHVYQGGTAFPPLTADTAFGRGEVLTFKRSKDWGQPDLSQPFEFECNNAGDCYVTRHGDLIKRPHAGVLTTPAFLARYPTTDTNRNRARARWTFDHFLGVDIEKSAPRSTDPDALADTDNPTLNNPACTVCHERLDPVAGTFQNFSDPGNFRSHGTDSLADTYKYPELYGGEFGDTPYQPGDTWYRDMRAPGINGQSTDKKIGSVQWLARQIVNDPRFAKATVAFWWPAIMGRDVLEQPTEETDPNYQQHLNAYNAQQALMDELAQKFRNRNFKAKHLFADMIMSPWFRAEGFEVEEGEERDIELATIGAGRLLTPEELDRKNYALFGARWDMPNGSPFPEPYLGRLSPFGVELLAYGGIDSSAILDRAREITPLMSNVSERMAIEHACRTVVWDMYRGQRNSLVQSCAQDPWYEYGDEDSACSLAPPAARPRVLSLVTKETVPNAQNKLKIENQLVKLYEHMYGLKVARTHPDIKDLYSILRGEHDRFKRQGWISNSCWMGSGVADQWQADDPQGMIAAWSTVMRAMMANYLYLHE